MVGIGSILGGKGQIVEQMFVWNVASAIVQALVAPYLESVSEESWASHPVLPLSPAQLGQLVERGYMDEGAAAEQAKLSGLNAERFGLLWRAMRLPIAPQEAAQALRRGILPEDSGDPNVPSFRNAIAQGDLGVQWADVIKGLATIWPSPTDALDALLEGQLDESAAMDLYKRLGGDPQFFTLLFNTRGSAPTPVQAADMANRGIIPWEGTGPDAVSFQQAFLEGPWRNKWLDAFRKDAEYFPPPRTVTAMVKAGSLSDADGLDLLEKQGLSPKLAQAYISDAHRQATTGTKDLAQSTILSLYHDQLIDSAKATEMLKLLGYDDEEAGFILAVADTQLQQQMIHTAIGRIHTLYVNRKIRDNDALAALNQLGVGGNQVDSIITTWKLERSANIKVLTPAQIAAAFGNKILSQDDAISELVAIGYTAYDGWILLSNHMKEALPNQPSKVPTPIEDVLVT